MMGNNQTSILSPSTQSTLSSMQQQQQKENKSMLLSAKNFEIEYHDIFLDLSEKGLGISIRGGIDSPNQSGLTEIYVSRILNAGAVHQDGDVIVSVNDVSLIGVTHKQAVQIIINAGPYIQFKIKRRKFLDSSDIYEQILDCDEDEPLLIGQNNYSTQQLLLDDSMLDSNSHLKGYNDCIKVELIRNINGFGFSLQGGLDNPQFPGDTGIYVDNIINDSPAHLNGQIAIGDEIVAINDTNLECVPYQWALDIIRNSPALSIFTVRKRIQWD